MFKVLSALALSLSGAAPMTQPDAARPIQLKLDRQEDFLDISVVANGASEGDARFELEVASEGRGGTTKTVQSGTSRRRASGDTLLTSRIRTSGLAKWNIRLHVTVGNREYVALESSDG